ncbi:phasin family protein [Ruegeria pomeroyi]|uniref:Phasin family protein n=1 Tax=Ruegeria alba TaxID=2916756 RepID=A0ABS9NTV9_9RHOB|nr:phasin family protein [Ruegeria alba]MCE8512282.1 phasin family protein [Ruegeria pomeroyi]MCG6557654.1 phasin family protein [Ruegeria alba]
MTTWYDITTESIRFATARFQHALETQQALLTCKKPEDFIRLQSEYFQNAFEQYLSEAGRFAGMMSNSTAQALGSAKSAYSRSYDDVPL